MYEGLDSLPEMRDNFASIFDKKRLDSIVKEFDDINILKSPSKEWNTDEKTVNAYDSLAKEILSVSVSYMLKYGALSVIEMSDGISSKRPIKSDLYWCLQEILF